MFVKYGKLALPNSDSIARKSQVRSNGFIRFSYKHMQGGSVSGLKSWELWSQAALTVFYVQPNK